MNVHENEHKHAQHLYPSKGHWTLTSATQGSSFAAKEKHRNCSLSITTTNFNRSCPSLLFHRRPTLNFDTSTTIFPKNLPPPWLSHVDNCMQSRLFYIVNTRTEPPRHTRYIASRPLVVAHGGNGSAGKGHRDSRSHQRRQRRRGVAGRRASSSTIAITADTWRGSIATRRTAICFVPGPTSAPDDGCSRTAHLFSVRGIEGDAGHALLPFRSEIGPLCTSRVTRRGMLCFCKSQGREPSALH